MVEKVDVFVTWNARIGPELPIPETPRAANKGCNIMSLKMWPPFGVLTSKWLELQFSPSTSRKFMKVTSTSRTEARVLCQSTLHILLAVYIIPSGLPYTGVKSHQPPNQWISLSLGKHFITLLRSLPQILPCPLQLFPSNKSGKNITLQ